MDVSLQTVTQSLRTMGIIGDDHDPAFEPLAGGVSSDIWRVETARGPICVKRARARLAVDADWCAPLARNAVEVAWMRTAGTILPEAVPQILAEDRSADLFAMSYLDPASHPTWKSGLMSGTVEPRFAAEVGARLARLHASTADCPQLAQTFANDDLFEALRIDPYLIAAGHAHPDLADRLVELAGRTLATRRTLIHGDISPKNILMGPNGPVFLDAECAVYGDPAFDLAFCLTHLLLKTLAHPQNSRLYLFSYRLMSDRYMHGVNWEAEADLNERAAALLPALLMARVDGKSPVEYLDSTTKDIARRFASEYLTHPVSKLDQVATAWQQHLLKAGLAS